MKSDLEFANTEIERLRAKLIIDNEELPPLNLEYMASANIQADVNNAVSQELS